MDTIFEKYFYGYSDKFIEHCKNCWAVKMYPFCYADKIIATGIADNVHIYCEQVTQYFKKIVWYHEILEEDPQKLDFLNNIVPYNVSYHNFKIKLIQVKSCYYVKLKG